MKTILSLALALMMVLSMGAFASAEELSYEEGTVLRMATGYNNKKTGLFFDADVAGAGITLADGETYYTGDLKPTGLRSRTSSASSSRTSTRAIPPRTSSSSGRIVWTKWT